MQHPDEDVENIVKQEKAAGVSQRPFQPTAESKGSAGGGRYALAEALARRRRRPAAPIKPTPNIAKEAGSGVGVGSNV